MSNYTSYVQVDVPQGLVAEIMGADTVNANELCAWVATKNGGTAPFSYDWTGIITGSTSIVEEELLQRDTGWLVLTVTDDNDWEVIDSFHVEVLSSGAPSCEVK